MTIEELESLIDEAKWFRHLTDPVAAEGYFQIPNLHPWAGIATDDQQLEEAADQMNWLPTTLYQDDPFYGKSLESRSIGLGKQKLHAATSRAVFKRTLQSLRSFDGHPALKIGPHDFSQSARSAAGFATRKAAYEAMLGEPGPWCEIVHLYKIGHWPCGILPSGKIVVL